MPTLTPDAPGRTLTLNEVMSAADAPLQVLLNGQPYDAATTELPQVGTTEEWAIVNMTGDTHPIHLHLVQFQAVSRQAFDTAAYETDWTALNGMPPFDHPTNTLDVTPYLLSSPTPPDANETGWKDTLRMNPGEVTRIRVRMAPQDTVEATPNVNKFPFDPTFGPGYVWHCHIVDHEDNEMMRPMEVTHSGKPKLQLYVKVPFWGSYHDYREGRLTVAFRLKNGPGGTAKNVMINDVSTMSRVRLNTPLPLSLGDIAAGSSADFVLKYKMPGHIRSFRTMMKISAGDTAGASYNYQLFPIGIANGMGDDHDHERDDH
jgi:hypothetical protein